MWSFELNLDPSQVPLIQLTTEILGLSDPSVIEKDVFVTQALHALADLTDPAFELVFCGGTCLAKAHQIIARMSEDVDFKIHPKIPFASHSEQRKRLGEFRDRVTTYLKEAGFNLDANAIRARDNNSYLVYPLEYLSLFQGKSPIRPHIQLEFTLASPRLPLEMKPVTTLIAQTLSTHENGGKSMACISVIETAAEKWVGLTRRVAAIARGHDPLDETLVRHLYDLNAIFKQVPMTSDFFRLAIETMDRDRLKFKRHPEYTENAQQEIQWSLDILGRDATWSNAYEHFIESMVFDDPKASFRTCYEHLSTLSDMVLLQTNQQNIIIK